MKSIPNKSVLYYTYVLYILEKESKTVYVVTLVTK